MTVFNNIQAVYLIGAGGIGVSALGRYFKSLGMYVAGYDKTPSPLISNLITEGIPVHFKDSMQAVPEPIKNCKPGNLLVIYTPAVPSSHSELNYFQSGGYKVLKRAEVLGLISENFKTVAVAGTHGKTSVSTMIAHIFHQANRAMSAILGGISKNYDSNLILSKHNPPEFIVTEADEFDRSFLHLHPHTLVLTSADADHLDIYEDIDDLHRTFAKLISQINKNGYLILKKSLPVSVQNCKAKMFTYDYDKKADFFAQNIELTSRFSRFDIVTPDAVIKNIRLNIPGRINIENAVGAAAAAYVNNISETEIRDALASWKAVNRRFEYIINTEKLIYIDDYAHHPEELKAFIKSVREIHKGKILGVFQPHLYTRTRDFADEFARELSQLDAVILLPIYPARELPLKNVNSKIILDKITIKNKQIIEKEDLTASLKKEKFDVILTMGAGDIDRLVKKVKNTLQK